MGKEIDIKRMQGRILVSVTAITVELGAVMKIAKEISLGANNAKAIAARAGDKARGFQPITNFIDEMARHTLNMVKQINQEALNISRTAAAEIRAKDAQNRYEIVLTKVNGTGHTEGFRKSVKSLGHTLDDLSYRISKQMQHLDDLLENINNDMRATTAISSSCRVEASRAEEFSEGLSVVADNLEQAVQIIKKHMKTCSSMLQEAIAIRRQLAA